MTNSSERWITAEEAAEYRRQLGIFLPGDVVPEVMATLPGRKTQ